MNARERWVRCLHFQPVDHVPDEEFGYWNENFKVWQQQGLPTDVNNNGQADQYFEFARRSGVPVSLELRPGFKSEVLEETQGTLTQYYQRGVVDWKQNPDGSYSLQRRLAWDYVGGGVGGSTDQGVEPGLTNPNPGTAYGPWGHVVSNYSVEGVLVGFKDFFDRLGGVSSFGFPKTDARYDDHPDAQLRSPGSDAHVIRQYFQAAVLEYHPGDPGSPVKIGLLGDTLRVQYPDNAWQQLGAFQSAASLSEGEELCLAPAGQEERCVPPSEE